MGRTSFNEIVSAPTDNDTRAVAAVDYITGSLVYDTFGRLHELLGDQSSEFEEKMQRMVTILKGHISDVNHLYESHCMKYVKIGVFDSCVTISKGQISPISLRR